MQNKRNRTAQGRPYIRTLLTLALIIGLSMAMPLTAYAADPPAAPSGLVSEQSPEGPILIWTDNSDNEDGFFIERKMDGSDSWTVLHSGTVFIVGSGTVGANVTTYTDKTAEEGKLYTYRVRAYNGIFPSQLYSAWSNERTHRVWPPPSELTAVAGAGGITLNWKANTTIHIGFVISRKEGSGSLEPLDNYVPATATTYLDTTAEVGKTYTYAVQATREEGFYSVFSNEAAATLLAPIITPIAITGPTTMTLTAGYAATSTGVYTTNVGATVTKTSGDAKITWNNTTKKLDIAAGLAAGTYPVELKATSGSDSATLTFTLTVTAAGAQLISGPATMTLTVGYAATSTAAYTVSAGATVTKTSGNAAILWNDSAKKLEIAAGLAAGTYPVVLTAVSGSDSMTLTFTLTVEDAAVVAPPHTAFPFIDVLPSDWFYNDVKTAYEMGLINGKTTTTFAPNDNLTYAEAVKLAACMRQYYTAGSVTLVNGNPVWYSSYVDYAQANGIISGSADYNWTAPATRAGYMAIFANALPDAALTAINTVTSGAIPDVPLSHAQATAIYMLYRAGIVEGVDAAHNCSPNSNIRRSEVAAIITRMMDPTARKSFTLE